MTQLNEKKTADAISHSVSKFVAPFQALTPDQQPAAGGKGSSLARLLQAGFPVPNGLIIFPEAFVADRLRPQAWQEVQELLTDLRAEEPEAAFAVRSSALAEDSAQASFAGEFESVLNVRADADILSAIHTVYQSRDSERVRAYSRSKGLEEVHKIAVVVQRLVDADCSGVMFTANPITGVTTEVMISAAWGLGEAIVQGVVTPDTIRVNKADGEILGRETAEKQRMTVRRAGGTEEQPVPKDLRRAPVLTDDQAAQLARTGMDIEAFYGVPMDIEWVRQDQTFIIVQARPITALPVPEPPPPSEWRLPPGMYAALRNNIVELMADPLSPLFRTLGLAAVNASMNRNLATFFGSDRLMPEELIISVNQYAYYNGSLSAGQMLRLFWRSVPIARHMFSGAVERWTEDGRPHYISTVSHWRAQPWPDYSTVELIDAARTLTEAAVDAYVSLVSGVIPAAWISEGLFTKVYNILIKRRDDPTAQTFLLGFDSLPIRAEKALYDLAQWTRTRPDLARFATKTETTQFLAYLKSDLAPGKVAAEDWQALLQRFQTHLEQYGHTIYNLDFANPVPADDPAPIVEIFRMFVGGEGADPHRRQGQSAARRQQATKRLLGRLKRIRLKLFRKLLTTAQRYAPMREDGLADVGLSYPLLRQMLREVGQRFRLAGVLDAPEDIFWLEEGEVRQTAVAIDKSQPVTKLNDLVAQRRAEWQAARRVSPPLGLSGINIFGFNPMEMRARRRRKDQTGSLKGVAASPGQVTAVARVLHVPQEFTQMQTGDILVAPLTTPAWTPLFARAAGIVTDVGGPLSHGSIVAREYGIPAVLGTGNATTIIKSGQRITVDGTTGIVTLERLMQK